MNGRDDQRGERKAVMQQAYREELVELIGRAVSEDGVGARLISPSGNFPFVT